MAWTLAHPSRLDAKTVVELQGAVSTLRYHREDSMPVVRLLVSLTPLTEAIKQLLAGTQPPAVREALCTVAVHTFTFAGSLSFDLRDAPSMQQFYTDADSAAHELRDRWLAALVLSAKSMLLLHGTQEVTRALDLAEGACAQAALGSSAIIRARAHAILAEMAAAKGDGRRSERELGLAKFHVEHDQDDDPAGSFVGESRHAGLDGIRAHLHGFDGACQIRLGHWRKAEALLCHATLGLPRSGTDRQRSIILADLALTKAKLGDHGHAAHLLGQSIAIAARVGGTVPSRRIYEVRREFDPAQHAPLARALDEQLYAAALLR